MQEENKELEYCIKESMRYALALDHEKKTSQRKFSNRSDRVKAVDFHPTEPWLLAALYNGNALIWNHETQNLVKTFEVTDLPVRAAKFIARKSWLVAGSDDMHIRVFNYQTHEKVAAFEAHSDYIRHIAVHPTQPFILSTSDDMLIKLWDWDKGWRCVMVFEGHTHFVMQAVFNPKDLNTFASASLDKTIKVWSLGSNVPNYTLEGHEKGVNCVDYYHGGDKPYLVSGADDKTVKVWDYQNKTCVQTLEGHLQNVTVAAFHPELPIIISGSEDERVWAVGYLKGVNDVALGFDDGSIIIKMGREEPAVSMDNSGKLIWARHNEIRSANLKASTDENFKDGERIALQMKELGSCEVYPQTLQHSPNGRFVVVCGDGEWIIYTAIAWRNKEFGSALEFVWALDSNEYAIRESSSRIRLFKNFKEKTNVSVKPSYSAEGIFGGALLGVRSNSFLNFYDWETGVCVRRVDVVAKSVFWSESELVAIACEDTTYVLKFHRVTFQQILERSGPSAISEEGIEEAFEFVAEVSDAPVYLLGYIPRDNRIYVTDKDMKVFAYSLPLSLIEYQTNILRGDLEMAKKILPSVPTDQLNRIARFLEAQNMKEEALAVSTDPEHRFDLAIQLHKLDLAETIATELDIEEKWKTVGDAALAAWKAKDLEGLLLMYQASGNADGISDLAEMATEKGKHNIAFICYMMLGSVDKAIEVLLTTERTAEAALLARTFAPSHIPRVTKIWKEDLAKAGKKKISDSIADSESYENLFPDIKYGLMLESIANARKNEKKMLARDYLELKELADFDFVAELKSKFPNGPPGEVPAAPLANGDSKVVNGSAAEAEADFKELMSYAPDGAEAEDAIADEGEADEDDDEDFEAEFD
ncbi:Coatomer subunit beta' [Cladochytrium tenue]|nr:Coatomer subunit beta' [Cladochytrium tenue]